ncbi:MAG: glycosyltransferase family 2 protein [Terrimicrobiaceae bacterium]|nr:glycosyltransferase family 2 protein [Terrimicrobiaceae bacterium]
MTEPYFTVVTPSWNQGVFLGKCLASVAAQEEPDVEHLVFDNCSTDESASVAARFPGVTFVSESDSGQSNAVNKGFLAARGEIVCWLNSDDEYPPGTFAKLRKAFSDPRVQVVFGHARQIGYDGGGEAFLEARFERRENLVRWWTSDARLHQPAVFFRRSLRERTGLLDETLHFAMDYEYWWRMSAIERFVHIPEVLAIQHRQPDSKTIRAWASVYRERERIFSPFYDLIDRGNRKQLLAEKKRAMVQNYLQLAWSCEPGSAALRDHLAAAWREDWRALIRPSSLGLLRRWYKRP